MQTHLIIDLATQIGSALQHRQATITTAESCTGGGLAQALTAVPGASAWFNQGVITYSDAAKKQLLGVRACLLEQFGAVSAQVAAAMASGALAHSQADYAVAVTGIAGPDGGSALKPVGLVYFGFACRDEIVVSEQRFHGNRHEIRATAVVFALQWLSEKWLF